MKIGDLYIQDSGGEYVWLILSNDGSKYMCIWSRRPGSIEVGRQWTDATTDTWRSHTFIGNINDILNLTLKD